MHLQYTTQSRSHHHNKPSGQCVCFYTPNPQTCPFARWSTIPPSRLASETAWKTRGATRGMFNLGAVLTDWWRSYTPRIGVSAHCSERLYKNIRSQLFIAQGCQDTDICGDADTCARVELNIFVLLYNAQTLCGDRSVR